MALTDFPGFSVNGLPSHCDTAASARYRRWFADSYEIPRRSAASARLISPSRVDAISRQPPDDVDTFIYGTWAVLTELAGGAGPRRLRAHRVDRF